MSAEDIMITMFCKIDDNMTGIPKHPQASLHPGEIVTLACLFVLKGSGTRAFSRRIQGDRAPLFPRRPRRTRLFRLLATHWERSERLLADPAMFGVIDADGIEFIHPIREGRRDRPIGQKGISNHRGMVGGKLCLLLNKWGLAAGWDCETANGSDLAFQPLIQAVEDRMIAFSETGFHAQEGAPLKLKFCPKGRWNDRMLIETVLSMLTAARRFKRMRPCAWSAVKARLAFGTGLFNLLVEWHGRALDETGFFKLSMAEFSL